MQIFKIAQVDDFMQGVSSSDIDKMPPEEELTAEQGSEIHTQTLRMNSTYQKLPYFMKYPKYTYFSMWDLRSSIGQNESRARILWEKFKTGVKNPADSNIPTDLPAWMYSDIIDTHGSKTINEDVARDVLMNPDNYPQVLFEFIKTEHSEI